MKRFLTRVGIFAALLGLGLAMRPVPAPVPAGIRGADGYKKQLHFVYMPGVEAQQSVGPAGPPAASSSGTTFTGGAVTSSITTPVDVGYGVGVNGGEISQQSAGVPDQSGFWTGTTGNAWLIAENADKAFNFAHAQATDPTLFIHSHNQSTTEWTALGHDGTTGFISTGKGDNSGLRISPDAASSTNGFTFFRRGGSATIESTTGAIGQTFMDKAAGEGYCFFNGSFGKEGCLAFNTAQTPDATAVQVGPLSNSLLLVEYADRAFDFAHALATDPTLFVHSHNQSTTEWVGIKHDGTDAQITTGSGAVRFPGTVKLDSYISGTTPAVGSNLYLPLAPAQTPDTGMLLTGTAANSFILAEFADSGFDFAHAQQTDPTLFIHSHNQSTTQWMGLAHNGANAVISSGLGPVALASGSTVASATAMPLPTGNVFHVSGTTNITSITSTSLSAGMQITLIFDGVLTFTDGNNLKLAGNFVTTADDTITLAYDGTNWYETARAVN